VIALKCMLREWNLSNRIDIEESPNVGEIDGIRQNVERSIRMIHDAMRETVDHQRRIRNINTHSLKVRVSQSYITPSKGFH